MRLVIWRELTCLLAAKQYQRAAQGRDKQIAARRDEGDPSIGLRGSSRRPRGPPSPGHRRVTTRKSWPTSTHRCSSSRAARPASGLDIYFNLREEFTVNPSTLEVVPVTQTPGSVVGMCVSGRTGWNNNLTFGLTGNIPRYPWREQPRSKCPESAHVSPARTALTRTLIFEG